MMLDDEMRVKALTLAIEMVAADRRLGDPYPHVEKAAPKFLTFLQTGRF